MFSGHHNSQDEIGDILGIFKQRAKSPLMSMGCIFLSVALRTTCLWQGKPVPNTSNRSSTDPHPPAPGWLQAGRGQAPGVRAWQGALGSQGDAEWQGAVGSQVNVGWQATGHHGAAAPGCPAPAPAHWEPRCQHERTTGNETHLLGTGRRPTICKFKEGWRKKDRAWRLLFTHFAARLGWSMMTTANILLTSVGLKLKTLIILIDFYTLR